MDPFSSPANTSTHDDSPAASLDTPGSTPWTAAAPALPAHARTPQLAHQKIFGTGEMAERTRSFAWSSTSVGPVEAWPDALLMNVNTLLACPHPMLLWWGKDLLQFYNDSFRNSLGTDRHPAALGQKGADCWSDIWHVIGGQIEQVMNGGAAIWEPDFTISLQRNGVLETIHSTYAFSPVRNAQGEICGVLVPCMENTHKKLDEQALRDELQRLSELFEQAPAFFCVLRGPDHVFERFNPRYRQLLGDRALIGLAVRDAVPEVEAQGFIGLLDGVYQSGEPFVGHNTLLKLSREPLAPLEERIIDFVYQPMRGPEGTVTGILVLGTDTTDSKRAEQALFQAEKLVAVGRLATSIAHEINNPLESVANLLYLIKDETHSPEAIIEHVQIAQQEVRRIANITINTLKFFRKTTYATPTSLEEVAGSVLAMFEGRIKHSGVRVTSRYRRHGAFIAFGAELRQVIANFLSNALDATSLGGRILLRVQPLRDGLKNEPGVMITIADTGSGMDRKTLSQIFDAFFTTKEVTGTGLGLWVSHELIRKHLGRIQVRSRQAQAGGRTSGTVFRLFLPYNNGLGARAADATALPQDPLVVS